jgi:hypothetical protein
MPSTQRTTPVVSPCRALVVASFGGGWSDITNPRTHRPVTRCWADLQLGVTGAVENWCARPSQPDASRTLRQKR